MSYTDRHGKTYETVRALMEEYGFIFEPQMGGGCTAYSLVRNNAAHYLITAQISEVISGTANGADRLGENFAAHYSIKLTRFPTDWQCYGRSAGIIRNREMAQYADALIALWDGESRGTANMIKTAKKEGLSVFVQMTQQYAIRQ